MLFGILSNLQVPELFRTIQHVSKTNFTLSKITTENKKLHQTFLVGSGAFKTSECCYFCAILRCPIQNQQCKIVLRHKTDCHYSSNKKYAAYLYGCWELKKAGKKMCIFPVVLLNIYVWDTDKDLFVLFFSWLFFRRS